MENNIIGLLLVMSASLFVGACKKELNVFPTTSEVDGNLITDQKTAQTVLNGVYYRFANAGPDIIANTTGTRWPDPNEEIPSILSGMSNFFTDTTTLDNAYLYPYTIGVGYVWNYGYALVNAANGFIKNVASGSGVPAAAKQQMLAEALFLRAFGNSELLLYYGQYNDPSSKYGIILRDTFVTPANMNQPRSGVAAAYTSILTDLDKAIAGLPVLNSAIYYANASAAKLLRARVLINRGAAGDYAEVISLTNDIITNSPFVLEDSLKDIFLTRGLSSKEVMLGMQPYPGESYKLGIYQGLAYTASDSLVSFLADDSRNQWVYKASYNSYYNVPVSMITKYYSGDLANLVPTQLSGSCYAFRLSEAYLLEAEAMTLSGGDLAAARSLLTTVMSHAGAGAREMAAVASAATPAALQLEIVRENIRNFAFENGVDWLALRRLPLAVIHGINPNIMDQNKLILPIPATELAINNVIQNPGY